MHGIVVNIGTAPAASRGIALRQHAHDLFEPLGAELAIRLGVAKLLVQIIQRPLLAADFGDDLLGQRVQWGLRDVDAVQLALVDGVEQGGRLQQVVQRQRKQPALGRGTDAVPGTAHTL